VVNRQEAFLCRLPTTRRMMVNGRSNLLG
jgi:hypothetical protein